MSVVEPSPFTFHMSAGEDWVRVIPATSHVAQAKMEVRNSMEILVATLDSTAGDGTIVINNVPTPPTLTLHLTTAETLKFGIGFPGVVQSVGYWGIGRAFLYDIFVKYTSAPTLWQKLQYGTIQVVQAVTTDLS